MKQGLRLSDSLTLPVDAVTQTLAVIGRRGAGKTYLSGLLAEQMIDAGAQTIILDPVGNWWGLRLMADGKTKGKDIFILGGKHGDVPISKDAGARLAQLLVEKPFSALIDTSEFREGERKRFAADFAEEFFQLKKSQNSAVHLFIEEAQLFAPQNPRPSRGEQFSEQEMLGAFERIIRLGRNYGIGATLITQRPQSVNKEVLNQTECLCVLQVNGRHEREALQKWVEEHSASDRALVGELPGLPQGEGFVWSPSWLRIFQRMKFAQKVTFDSTATPKVGAKTKAAATLSKMDVASLKSDLQEVIARAETNDPKKLRKKIEELEKELKKRTAPAAAPTAKVENLDRELLLKAQKEEIERVIRDVVRPQIAKSFHSWTDKTTQNLTASLKTLQHNMAQLDDPTIWTLYYLSKTAEKAIQGAITTRPRVEYPTKVDRPAAAPARERKRSEQLTTPNGSSPLSGPEQRILNSIAWFDAIGITEPEQVAVAFMAGYSARSSSYTVPRSVLSRIQAIEYVNGRIKLTDAGRELSNVPDIPKTNEALRKAVFAKLPGPESRLLSVLVDAWPGALTSEDLATAAGYSAKSSSFSVPRSRLSSFGLIEYPSPGRVRAADILFPLHGE
jgi:hypothetical protein